MSVIAFPESLKVKESTWAQQRNDIEFRSVFGAQALEGLGPLWVVTLEFVPGFESDSGDLTVLGLQLRGRTNQLALWYHGRPVPRGTMRGTMMLNSSASQGATMLSIIASGQASKTLLKKDFLGIGSGLTQQVVMVTGNATSDGSGVISVTVEPPLRNTFSAGESITWNRPKALFRRASSRFGWSDRAALTEVSTLELIEDWRP